MDIKIIGCRPGERLYEPLWLKEENPTRTKYQKLFTLTSQSPGFNLDELLQKMKPICFFDSEKTQMFRNREMLIEILRAAVPSLDEFYSSNENKKGDASESSKVVL